MLPEFDTQLWLAAVEKAVVYRDGKNRVCFERWDGVGAENLRACVHSKKVV